MQKILCDQVDFSVAKMDNQVFAPITEYNTQIKRKVTSAIILMASMSIFCSILATIVWEKDRHNKHPSKLLLVVLFILIAIFDLF